MRAFGILAANTWRELLRTRFMPVVALFGGVLVYMGLLLGALAGDVELRVLLDVGMSVVELMTCGAVAYCAATGLLQEIETKTLYLVLTRPVPRHTYLLGRFTGATAAAASAALLMGLVEALLLLFKGWRPGWELPLALWGVGLEIVVTAAAATLLALISTSVLSAMTMTGIVWVLGHFVPEIRFLAHRSHAAAAKLLLPAVYLLPDFSRLNFRDHLHLPGTLWTGALFGGPLYAAAYALVCLGLTAALFSRKEF